MSNSSPNGHVTYQHPQIVIDTGGSEINREAKSVDSSYRIHVVNDNALIDKVRNILKADQNVHVIENNVDPEKKRFTHEFIVSPNAAGFVVAALGKRRNVQESTFLLDPNNVGKLHHYPVVALTNIRNGLLSDTCNPTVALAIKHEAGKNDLLKSLKVEAGRNKGVIPLEVEFEDYSLVVVPRDAYDRFRNDSSHLKLLNNLLMMARNKDPNFTPVELPLPDLEQSFYQTVQRTRPPTAALSNPDVKARRSIDIQKQDAIVEILGIFSEMEVVKDNHGLGQAVNKILGGNTVRPERAVFLYDTIKKWHNNKKQGENGLDHLNSDEASVLRNFAVQLENQGFKDFFDIIPKPRRGRPPKPRPDTEVTPAPPKPAPEVPLHPIRLSPQKNAAGEDGYMITVAPDAIKGTEAMVRAWASFAIREITDKSRFGRAHFWVDKETGDDILSSHLEATSRTTSPESNLKTNAIVPIGAGRKDQSRGKG